MQLPIKTYNDVLAFGKHRGKSVDWVAEHHPSYIIWLKENNVCEVDDEIYDAALADDMDNGQEEDYFLND